MEDMTVVSEMGEQWSPKIPPDSTTPMAMPTGAPMEMARDTAMGMKMANTLQELPVEKEVRQAAMKMIAHIEVGVRKLSQVLTIVRQDYTKVLDVYDAVKDGDQILVNADEGYVEVL